MWERVKFFDPALLPGCGEGMDSMVHVISSGPFSSLGVFSGLLLFPRQEESKNSSLGLVSCCFLTLFNNMNNCCP